MQFFTRCLVALALSGVLSAAHATELGEKSLLILKTYTTSHSAGTLELKRSNSFRTMLTEQLLSREAGEVEIEYDLPPALKGNHETMDWMFPLRLRKDARNDVKLLNRADLERRRAAWLQQYPKYQALCQQTHLHWPSVFIYCDIEDAMAFVAEFDFWFSDTFYVQEWREPGSLDVERFDFMGKNSDGFHILKASFDYSPKWLRDWEASRIVALNKSRGREGPTYEEQKENLNDRSYAGILDVYFTTDDNYRIITRAKVSSIIESDAAGNQMKRRNRNTLLERRPMP